MITKSFMNILCLTDINTLLSPVILTHKKINTYTLQHIGHMLLFRISAFCSRNTNCLCIPIRQFGSDYIISRTIHKEQLNCFAVIHRNTPFISSDYC